mmetsp:Transcript_95650/g.279722  ORF Transcript_95650/g.279722 Transcript_95650/m.279722 type:complete len:219 (-) Transcript_95650:515-1171(-)
MLLHMRVLAGQPRAPQGRAVEPLVHGAALGAGVGARGLGLGGRGRVDLRPEGALAVLLLLQHAPHLVSPLHVLDREARDAVLQSLADEVEVARHHLPAGVGDLRVEGALSVGVLRPDLHAPLLRELKGLLPREEVLLSPLEIHRVPADAPGGLVHAWRALRGLAQVVLLRGAPLLRELRRRVEPLLDRSQHLQAAGIPLAQRPVHLVPFSLDYLLTSA